MLRIPTDFGYYELVEPMMAKKIIAVARWYEVASDLAKDVAGQLCQMGFAVLVCVHSQVILSGGEDEGSS